MIAAASGSAQRTRARNGIPIAPREDLRLIHSARKRVSFTSLSPTGQAKCRPERQPKEKPMLTFAPFGHFAGKWVHGKTLRLVPSPTHRRPRRPARATDGVSLRAWTLHELYTKQSTWLPDDHFCYTCHPSRGIHAGIHFPNAPSRRSDSCSGTGTRRQCAGAPASGRRSLPPRPPSPLTARALSSTHRPTSSPPWEKPVIQASAQHWSKSASPADTSHTPASPTKPNGPG